MNDKYTDVDVCLEAYDYIFVKLHAASQLSIKQTVLFYLLRHSIISEVQVYRLLSNSPCSSVNSMLSKMIKEGYIKRNTDKNEVTTFVLTPSGCSASSSMFITCCKDKGIDKEFFTSSGRRRLEFSYIIDRVLKSDEGAKGMAHHSSAARDSYILLAGSGMFFSFSSESVVSSGEVYSQEEKKFTTGYRGGSQKMNLWCDAVFNVFRRSAGLPTSLMIEQDCGTEKLSVIDDKLNMYLTEFLAPHVISHKNELIDYILCFTVSYPTLVHKRPTALSEFARISDSVLDVGEAVACALGKSSSELTLGELAGLLEHSDAVRYASRIRFLRSLDPSWGLVSLQNPNIPRTLISDFESKGNPERRSISIRRRALNQDIFINYRRYFSRGFSLVSLPNLSLGELGSVMTQINSVGYTVLNALFGDDVFNGEIKYEPLHAFRLDDNLVAFRNVYETLKGFVVVENPVLDVGARERYYQLGEHNGSGSFTYVFLFREGSITDMTGSGVRNVVYMAYSGGCEDIHIVENPFDAK